MPADPLSRSGRPRMQGRPDRISNLPRAFLPPPAPKTCLVFSSDFRPFPRHLVCASKNSERVHGFSKHRQTDRVELSKKSISLARSLHGFVSEAGYERWQAISLFALFSHALRFRLFFRLRGSWQATAQQLSKSISQFDPLA